MKFFRSKLNDLETLGVEEMSGTVNDVDKIGINDIHLNDSLQADLSGIDTQKMEGNKEARK